MFCLHLKRMCILLLLDEKIYIYMSVYTHTDIYIYIYIYIWNSNFLHLLCTVTFASSNSVLFYLKLMKCFRSIKLHISWDGEVSPYLVRLKPQNILVMTKDNTQETKLKITKAFQIFSLQMWLWLDFTRGKDFSYHAFGWTSQTLCPPCQRWRDARQTSEYFHQDTCSDSHQRL